VGIGAGGHHIADESWELDRGCDMVPWCGILERGVDPRGVDLGSVGFPRGVDLAAEFCLPCLLLRCFA
jgi:hypothetical protein